MRRTLNGIAICLVLCLSACRRAPLFDLLPSSATGIHFNNKIIETDSLNPLFEVNVYNGGGVGIGDFNNDGLQDVYFTGNLVSNKLYLNKGDFHFEDVTDAAGVSGNGKWCKGISVVDINNDGKQDIYVSVSMSKDPRQRENLLYINEGADQHGVPVFRELAKEYGLNDDSHTTMAEFFDYDNDGDLDVYLVVNEHVGNENQNVFKPIMNDGSHASTGRLYRNDWSPALKHGVFTNVSHEAGITIEGYGHSAIIDDINKDGWKDIYVTNDFITNNILYINNHNGTFTDRSKEYFKQTSLFSMGVDMQDLNNDGLLDVVELDMNPQDNYRKKMMLGPNNYQNVANFEKYNYQLQYSRNTVQINQGEALLKNDSVSHPVFSQLGYLCGVAETDWSWTPLVTDFDDDGLRDIIITNGFPKDITDHDFMVFRSQASPVSKPAYILSQVPQVKLHNYAFKNTNGFQFDNYTSAWGLNVPGFSNGAAYADLDNDGDMDLVVNNIDDEAFVYKNNTSKSKENHFLNIKFQGDEKNIGGFGTWVNIFYDSGRQQVYEHFPYRGYLSSLQPMAHFGLGEIGTIDSLVVVWPDLQKQVLTNIASDQVLTLRRKDAQMKFDFVAPKPDALFTDVTDLVNIHYSDRKNDYIDFNVQKLLPHKLSEYSPALAAGDLDGNGLDDIICGGNSKNPAQVFLQQKDGSFRENSLFAPSKDTVAHPYGKFGIYTDLQFSDEGVLLFDADNDGDQDLYISSGGYEHDPNTTAYQDRFYKNDGAGNFLADSTALPQNFASKFCVRAADYDNDGDLDLFVAGRVEPWAYPKPVSSFIFRNDSHNGVVKFTDVTSEVANDLFHVGLVCDAVFTDYNNDGWQDLIIAGEWMPVMIFKNNKGTFENVTGSSGLATYRGWWNTIAPADFDNDGDIDYIIGNLGLNSFYKASEKYPVHITAAYFDNNASYDAFPSVFLPASQDDTTRKEFPVHQWEDVNKQMISMRAKFPNFKAYANATFADLFLPEQLEDALRLDANTLQSVFMRNNGNGKFTIIPLPIQAQVSVLGGMVPEDFDHDGNIDLVMNGNDYGTEVSVGRYDAMNGLFLKGDGKGNFAAQTIMQSGIYIPGNGKALVECRSAQGKNLLAASQHNGPLKIFQQKRPTNAIALLPLDRTAVIKYKNGTEQRKEFYYGYSFLSQSARFINIEENMVSISITDGKGATRTILSR